MLNILVKVAVVAKDVSVILNIVIVQHVLHHQWGKTPTHTHTHHLCGLGNGVQSSRDPPVFNKTTDMHEHMYKEQ